MVPKARVDRFEDLVARQKARVLNSDIYELTRQGEMARDREFIGQIRRASLSVMSNIAEGFERGGRGELAHFLLIAKASAGEVRSLLYAAIDAGYIDDPSFRRYKSQADEVGRILGELRAAVVRQKHETHGRANG